MPLPTNLTNHKALEIYYDAIAIYQTQDKDKTQLKVNESGALVIADYGADKVWLKGVAKAK